MLARELAEDFVRRHPALAARSLTGAAPDDVGSALSNLAPPQAAAMAGALGRGATSAALRTMNSCSQPAARSCSAAWLPRKPPPPVRTTRRSLQ